MTPPPTQLILDEIRLAALPQELSLGLTVALAEGLERQVKGEDPPRILTEWTRAIDPLLPDWHPVVLTTAGAEPACFTPVLQDSDSLPEVIAFLKEADKDRDDAWLQEEFSESDAQLWNAFLPLSNVTRLLIAPLRACSSDRRDYLVLFSATARHQPHPDIEALAAPLAATLTLLLEGKSSSLVSDAIPHTGTSADREGSFTSPWHQAICLVSRKSGEIRSVSPAAEALLARSSEALRGKTIDQMGATQAAAACLSSLRQNASRSPKSVVQLQHPTDPSGGCWMAVAARPIDPDAEASADADAETDIIFTLQDISAERASEERLAASRERLKVVQQAPSLALFEVDRHGALASIDGGLFGEGLQGRSGFVGRHAWTWCADASLRKRLWRQLRRAGHATFQTEVTVDASPIPVEITLAAIPGPNGKPRRVHGLAMPLSRSAPSDTEKVEQAPLETTGPPPLPSWLEAFHSTSEALTVLDASGCVRFLNRAAEKLFETRFDDVRGCPFSTIGSFGGIDPLTHWFSDSPKPGGLHPVSLRRHDGETLHLSLTGAPHTFDDGTQGSILTCRNDSQAHAKGLSESDREALEKESFKALATLAGGIAHDFNNILTSLVGNVSLANMLVTDSPEASERLVEAERACFRAKDLSHQLLTFAKGSSPIKKVTRLDDLVNQCAEFYLRDSKVSASIENEPGLWNALIDEGQVSQVLENLILNAEHRMPHGGSIKIATQNYRHEDDRLDGGEKGSERLALENGYYSKIIVRDTGVGIPADQLANIFKPYHVANDSGRGLGMATTFAIVKNHGGHIEAQSGRASGTEFTLYLPATGKAARPDKEPLTLERTDDGDETKQGRILVIDDEKSIRDLATTTLELMGCEVVSCASSSEGVERYLSANREESPFDLVIMDLTIPGDMCGNEAMQQILNISPQARGIASSGYSEGNVMAHYREYGFQAALSKPYNIGDLQRVVSNFLSN